MPTDAATAIIVNSLGFEMRAKQLLDFIVIKYEPKIANYIPASSQLMICATSASIVDWAFNHDFSRK